MSPIWIGYGLGLYQSSLGDCDHPWWGHTGWLAGYRSIAANTEDASRQVILLVNTDTRFRFFEGALFEAVNT